MKKWGFILAVISLTFVPTASAQYGATARAAPGGIDWTAYVNESLLWDWIVIYEGPAVNGYFGRYWWPISLSIRTNCAYANNAGSVWGWGPQWSNGNGYLGVRWKLRYKISVWRINDRWHQREWLKCVPRYDY